jgi:hypothetical protein
MIKKDIENEISDFIQSELANAKSIPVYSDTFYITENGIKSISGIDFEPEINLAIIPIAKGKTSLRTSMAKGEDVSTSITDHKFEVSGLEIRDGVLFTGNAKIEYLPV